TAGLAVPARTRLARQAGETVPSQTTVMRSIGFSSSRASGRPEAVMVVAAPMVTSISKDRFPTGRRTMSRLPRSTRTRSPSMIRSAAAAWPRAPHSAATPTATTVVRPHRAMIRSLLQRRRARHGANRVTFLAMTAALRVLCASLVVAMLGASGLDTWAAASRATRRPKPPAAARRTPARRAAIAPPSVMVPSGASARDTAVAEAAQRALAGAGGAVVAMDPHTGRVLSIVNPGTAVQHAYQPCSVFKIVVAIAGLTEGVITPSTLITCDGGCWFWPGHGPVDLRRALANSCNPYFQRVGERLGYEKIQRYAYLLGLGSKSGINVGGDETAGRIPYSVVPAGVAKLSSHAEGIATSPLQLAVLVSTVVNGGVVFQPQLGGAEGFVPKERWRLPRGTVLQGLADGFLSAVNEGSAAEAFDPDIVVAGKTGTCAGLGWFASYAPADNPEIVLVVFLRSATGHQASSVAGRIYQDLYKPPPATLAAGHDSPAGSRPGGGPRP